MGCGPSQPSRVYDPNSGGVNVKYATAPPPYRPAYVQPYAPQPQVYVQQQHQPAPMYNGQPMYATGQPPMYANNGQYYAQGPPPGQYGQPQTTVVYANSGPAYQQQQQQQQGGMGVGGAVAMGFLGGMVAAELFD
jgi:hypothetical protein